MALYVPDDGPVIFTWLDCNGHTQRIRISRVRRGKYRKHIGIDAPQSVKISSRSYEKRLAKDRRNRIDS
jgi:hypothetical protein